MVWSSLGIIACIVGLIASVLDYKLAETKVEKKKEILWMVFFTVLLAMNTFFAFT